MANLVITYIHHDVGPDSMLVLHAARAFLEEESSEVLDNVRVRVDEIETLHRTRELTVRFFLVSQSDTFAFVLQF